MTPGGAQLLAIRTGWLALSLVALVLAFHVPLRFSEYVQDDHLAVEENEIVERGDLREIFTTSYWEGAEGNDRTLYRPLPILTYAMERRIAGRPAAGLSQAVNIVLHILATLAWVAVVRRLGASAFVVAACGLFFAVHPVHVEAIANIVGRAEILAALFSFTAILALTFAGPWSDPSGRSVRRRPAIERGAAWAAALSLFLALASKEVALATPLLLLAAEALFRPAPGGRTPAWWIDRGAALAPCGLAILVYLALRVEALEMLVSLQTAHPVDNPIVTLSGGERVGTAFGLVTRYLGLLLYPTALSADYSGPVIAIERGLLAPRAALGAAMIAVLAAVGGITTLRSLRSGPGSSDPCLAGFAALVFLLPYLVIANLLFTIGTIFAERLLYFPSAGFCLALAMLLGFLHDGTRRGRGSDVRLRAAAAIVVLITLGYGLRTLARCTEWRSDRTVFSAAARAKPDSPRSHFILGKLEAEEGNSDAALERFGRTLELYPAYVAARFEIGSVHAARNEFRPAAEAFEEVVRISPTFAAAHLNLGLAQRRLGALGHAENALRKAVLWDAGLHRAWAELGNLLLSQQRHSEAAAAYRRAIALGRRDLLPRLELADRGDPS